MTREKLETFRCLYNLRLTIQTIGEDSTTLHLVVSRIDDGVVLTIVRDLPAIYFQQVIDQLLTDTAGNDIESLVAVGTNHKIGHPILRVSDIDVDIPRVVVIEIRDCLDSLLTYNN